MRIGRFVGGVMLAAALLPANAAVEMAPDDLVRRVTVEVLSILDEDEQLRSGDSSRARALIESKVVPHFDFVRMTALAVGRDWRAADAAQREALTAAFRVLLTRTYSNALTSYEDQSVDVLPVRVTAGTTDATVRTRVRQPGLRPLSIDYDLKKGIQGWKVYDVVVDGVSLVTTYRTSFRDEIRIGGIDGLIATLREKNDANQGAVADGG